MRRADRSPVFVSDRLQFVQRVAKTRSGPTCNTRVLLCKGIYESVDLSRGKGMQLVEIGQAKTLAGTGACRRHEAPLLFAEAVMLDALVWADR